MKLQPGKRHLSWRVFTDTTPRHARGRTFAIDDLDGVRAAYAAAYEAALETGACPGVSRVTVQGRLNGRGNWRRETYVHIERVGTDLDAPGLTAFDLTLSLDRLSGPAADMGYDLERYVRTGQLHQVDDAGGAHVWDERTLAWVRESEAQHG